MTEMQRKGEILSKLEQVKKKEIAEKHGKLRPIFCGGCGHFSALHAIYNTMSGLNINPKNLVIVSGIGCSGRFPAFVRCFGFHGVHGRALPIATGVKLANPSLQVIVVGGDGDGLSIGGGHLPQAARMNVDITYLLLDNAIYGLTKGQISPTSPYGEKSSTTPYGNPGRPLDPIPLALIYGATFVARGFSGAPDQLSALVSEGVTHKGFSLIHIHSPCVTFNKRETYEKYYNTTENPPDERDPANLEKAMQFAICPDKTYLGVFYQKREPTLDENALHTIEQAGKYNDGRLTG
ncbi:MAG: 2-oxoacid:ferredoxin oxidoreductase subunit beta [Waddliaceae bacterium]